MQPMAKPILLVTRRLPPAVEARAVRDYDARLNPEDVPRNGADIVRLAEGVAAILCSRQNGSMLLRSWPCLIRSA